MMQSHVKEMTVMKTVNEVSKLTGVSIRTLQYYDKIGLLKPAEYTESGYRLYDDAAAMLRIREAAENAKIELSGSMNANINLPYISLSYGKVKHLDFDITRAEFEKLTADLVEKGR